MSAVDVPLWVVLPYVCLATFVVGHVWRYRYDKFGWTTRSSELYERRLLRWGSPLFHYGILFAFLGHVVGLLVPKPWTDAVGISESGYHALSIGAGSVAGIAALAGLAILVYRRRTVGPVFSATTRNDKLMYAVLATSILSGVVSTVLGHGLVWRSPDYRETVAPWFRSVFSLHPHLELMAHAGVGYQVHAIAAMLLFALWPFTRLVHVLSAPLGYLTRPYIVYRSRTPELGSGTAQRGWERVGSSRR